MYGSEAIFAAVFTVLYTKEVFEQNFSIHRRSHYYRSTLVQKDVVMHFFVATSFKVRMKFSQDMKV